MTFIKGGVVTRIDIISNSDTSKKYIENSFNKELYNEKDSSYFIKDSIFTKNIFSLREELMEITDNNADSLENSEAYCLSTTVENLSKKMIHLTKSSSSFYFTDYPNIVFDTELQKIETKKYNLNIYFIPLIWDINRTETENHDLFTLLVNNLMRKALSNKLKDSLWFTITN